VGPITIALFLLIAGAFIFADQAFERLLRPMFRRVGLSTSAGPLVCRGALRGEGFELEIDNQGKAKVSIAAVSITGAQGETVYPVPFVTEQDAAARGAEKSEGELRRRLAADKIGPGESRTIYLSPQELEGCDLESLRVMDAHGGSWPAPSSG